MVQLPKLVAESDEMPHLDALRFFAAMGIVVFHFKGHLPLGGAQASFTTLRLLVDLFFVISGFVITYVYSSLSTFRQYRRFLVKRVARLWPLHLATASAMAAVGALVYFGVLHSDHRENYDLTRLPSNLFAMHAWGASGLSFNYPSWSISAEWGMYLIFPAVLFLSKRSLALPAAAVLVVGLSMLPGEPWTERTAHFGVLRALPSFLLGSALCNSRSALSRIPYPKTGLVTSALLFLAGSFWAFPPLIALLTVYAIAVFAVAADFGGADRVFAMKIAPLGTLTYSVYMLHALVEIGFITFLGERLLKLHEFEMALWVVAGVALTLGLAYLSLVFFERPARDFISGLAGGSRPRLVDVGGA